MKKEYDIILNNEKCISLTTQRSLSGKCNIYIHAVGENTHEHIYFFEKDGKINNQGISLKNNGIHIGKNVRSESASTETLFVAELTKNMGSNYNCRFTHTVDSTHIISDPSTSHKMNGKRAEAIYLTTKEHENSIKLSFSLLSKEKVNFYRKDGPDKFIQFKNGTGICISVDRTT